MAGNGWEADELRKSVANDRPAAEDLFKRAPEVAIEDGVDDGIERRVAVAEPEEDCEEHLGRLRDTRPGH